MDLINRLLNGHRIETRDRAIRLLRADLREAREHYVELARQLTSARQSADAAEAEAELAREALTAGHRELLAENRQLKAETEQQQRAIKQLHQQLWDARGYPASALAVIDAGGEEALAAIEKAARKTITTA